MGSTTRRGALPDYTVTVHVSTQINFLLRSNGEAWAVATAPQPDRYKHIDVINKRRVLLRATVGTYSAQTPPPSELRVSGGASLTA